MSVTGAGTEEEMVGQRAKQELTFNAGYAELFCFQGLHKRN